MKIVEANIYLLSIPFKFSFGHYLKKHSFSDSIIVELISDAGVRGYGEGIAREFVTGETVKKSVNHIKTVLLPAILKKVLPAPDRQNPMKILSEIKRMFPTNKEPGILAWNASLCAVELATVDCILKEMKESLNYVLPPSSKNVTYSGVLTSGSPESTVNFAKLFKGAGLRHIKIKVGGTDDHRRIGIVREIMGPSVSIRLDANGAFDVKTAISFINSVAGFRIDCIEQPVMRGGVKDLAVVRSSTSIPIMVDESLVTLHDAKRLIEKKACDYFNLRISKCGGLFNTLAIADIAKKSGIKIQLGCHVGETAVLSAAGRHLAAYLPDAEFVEGSFSTLLLTDDISTEKIEFGKGGKAPLLTGPGLGVNIRREALLKYAENIINVS